MYPVAREVRGAAGNDQLVDTGGVAKILIARYDCFAPEAAGSIYQGVVRFARFKRIAPSLDEFLAHFDLPRRKAESLKQIGGSPPEVSASIFREQNGPLSRYGESVAPVGVNGDLGAAAVARETGRKFGPPGSAVRQDVQAATEVGANSSDGDLAARGAYRKAEKSLAKKVVAAGG